MRANLSVVPAALLVLLAIPYGIAAQTVVDLQPQDKVSVRVDSDLTFDSDAGLYTYAYELRNEATSKQAVRFFALEFDSVIVNATAPAGWIVGQHADRPVISWAATEVAALPPDFVDDGNVPPSASSIQPGASLAGFSFQSADPPANARFYVLGDTPLPQAAGDVGELVSEEQGMDFTEDGVSGATVSPHALSDATVFGGGREPGVEGFLAFADSEDRQRRPAPVDIAIEFSVHGESIDRSTFGASLNYRDVTAHFVPVRGRMAARLDLGSSPLRLGRNVLITTVKGIDPRSGNTTADVDRLIFFVEK